MLAIAKRHARFKAECFYRPSRDGRVFFHHFPVRQLRDAGLLSLIPFGTSLHRTVLTPQVDAHGPAGSLHVIVVPLTVAATEER